MLIKCGCLFILSGSGLAADPKSNSWKEYLGQIRKGLNLAALPHCSPTFLLVCNEIALTATVMNLFDTMALYHSVQEGGNTGTSICVISACFVTSAGRRAAPLFVCAQV